MSVLDQEPANVLSDLTQKQIEVLDLLLQHKTSKQIARELNVAPNTVNARIAAIREKWGTTDRKATARVYAHLLETCNKMPCNFLPLENDIRHRQEPFRDLPRLPVFAVADAHAYGNWPGDRGQLGVLEALDARFGKFGRLGAAFVLSFLIAVTVVLSLAIAAGIDKLVGA